MPIVAGKIGFEPELDHLERFRLGHQTRANRQDISIVMDTRESNNFFALMWPAIIHRRPRTRVAIDGHRLALPRTAKNQSSTLGRISRHLPSDQMAKVGIIVLLI